MSPTPPMPASPSEHVPPARQMARVTSSVQAEAASTVIPSSSTPSEKPLVTKPLSASTGQERLLATQSRLSDKGAQDERTQVLETRQTGFTLLPPGALLQDGDRLYAVVEAMIEQPGARHGYLVEQLDAQIITCPHCEQTTTDIKERFCANCGMELSAVQPTVPCFYLREVEQEILVAMDRTLSATKLPREGLFLPDRCFAQTLWENQVRHYLVYPEKPATQMKSAAELPRPQPIEQVLCWGIILARALSHLHQQGIVHGRVDPTHIAVLDQDAWLTSFGGAQSIKDLPKEEAARLLGQDIVGLATSLLDLLGGAKASLPPSLVQVLRRGQGRGDGFFSSAEAFSQALAEALDNLQPRDVVVRVGHRTDVGVLRDHNEDNELVVEKGLFSRDLPLSWGVYIVADGMGGHAAGEIASDLAAESAFEYIRTAVRSLEQLNKRQLQEVVRGACLAASRAVYEERMRRHSDMGTTIVVALRIGDRVALGSIGDSRAYMIDAAGIRQITVDHSLVQRLIDTGQITEAEAKTHPQRNLIYKVVGDKPEIVPDTFSLRLRAGDRLLLCSDGLSGMIEEQLIWQTVMNYQDPQTACEQLIALANQAGGEDNITVIIVQVAQEL